MLRCFQLAGNYWSRILSPMSTVKEIEAAITKLQPEEIAAVAEWLAEFREEMWDRQIADDAQTGRFDSLIQKAKAEHRAGRATPFP